MKEALGGTDSKRIVGMSYLFYCLCFKARSRMNYVKKLDKAAAEIEREMDLGRFIRR